MILYLSCGIPAHRIILVISYYTSEGFLIFEPRHCLYAHFPILGIPCDFRKQCLVGEFFYSPPSHKRIRIVFSKFRKGCLIIKFFRKFLLTSPCVFYCIS